MSKVSYLDALGQVTRRIDPLGRVVSNVYDGQSRLISTTLPEGKRLEYTYDDAPCLTQKRCTHNVKTVNQVAKPGSGLATLTRSFTYESNFNQVASATDPRGLVTNHSLGRSQQLARRRTLIGAACLSRHDFHPVGIMS